MNESVFPFDVNTPSSCAASTVGESKHPVATYTGSFLEFVISSTDVTSSNPVPAIWSTNENVAVSLRSCPSNFTTNPSE